MSKRITNVKSGGGVKKVLAIVAVVLAFVLVTGFVSLFAAFDSGFVERHQVAMETENYKVTGAMMNYYFNTLYRNYAESFASMGLDTSKPLDEQDYIAGQQTWYDYFMDMTKSNVEQVLVLCEAANAAGFTLEDDDSHSHSPDETLATMEAIAAQSNVDLDFYLEWYYGAGVNEKVFRQCYELSELASHYSEHLMEQYDFSEEDWNTYYKENIDTFRKVDYLTFTFKVEKQKVASNATDEEKAAAEALDKEETARLDALSVELAATKDPAAFKAYVENYLKTDLYKDKTEEQLKKEKIDIASEVEGCLKEGATNSAESDLNKWLFDDKRVANETNIIKSKDGLSFTVYMILPAADTTDLGLACMYRDTYLLKNFRYIPFLNSEFKNSAKDAKAAADDVFADYKDDPTEKNFIKLADPETGYGDGAYEGGLVEGADKGAIGDEVDAWLYDSTRKEGDCAVIEVADKGSFIIYYVGDGDVKWQAQADTSLANDKYSEDYEALRHKYSCSVVTKGINLVEEVALS